MNSMDPNFGKSNVKAEEVSIENRSRKSVDPSTAGLLGVRILKCRSLVVLSGVLSDEEVDYLRASSLEAAAKQKDTLLKDNARQSSNLAYSGPGRFCVRMPTVSAANRNDIPDTGSDDLHDPLPSSVSQFVEERILQRVFSYIDQELADVRETLFGGDCTSLLQLYLDGHLEWSCREPAVNVYWSPDGHFGIHKDKKALTILMPLTSPGNDFTGGGTAFWSESYPNEKRHQPSLIMAPKAGTALLFGGNVSHKGVAIDTGNRVVFVASFSRRPNKKQSKTWVVSAR